MRKLNITHCIFDMDGLLIDSERIYSQVTSTIIGRYGHEFTYELKAPMMGQTAHAAAEYLIKATGIPLTAEAYLEERNRMQLELFPTCRPLPGVERLIRHLKKHNIPIAVASGSYKDAYKLKTMNHQSLFSLFDYVILGDDPAVKHGKPAPDIFNEARRQLGSPDASCCLVFEDAINGVHAAANAGMPVVWIPDPRANRNIEPPPTEVLDTLEHFDPARYGLPPFDE
ncbi:HAD-like domain-containing protein [Syncephalis plumigaleata]|nr:HAD-like domain-containing protein [Syncephalis plumigaleata]